MARVGKPWWALASAGKPWLALVSPDKFWRAPWQTKASRLASLLANLLASLLTSPLASAGKPWQVAEQKRYITWHQVYFIERLRQFKPDVIIGLPTQSSPSAGAGAQVINQSWNKNSSSNNLADHIGILAYEGSQALQYVKNFAQATQQWTGFPIQGPML